MVHIPMVSSATLLLFTASQALLSGASALYTSGFEHQQALLQQRDILEDEVLYDDKLFVRDLLDELHARSIVHDIPLSQLIRRAPPGRAPARSNTAPAIPMQNMAKPAAPPKAPTRQNSVASGSSTTPKPPTRQNTVTAHAPAHGSGSGPTAQHVQAEHSVPKPPTRQNSVSAGAHPATPASSHSNRPSLHIDTSGGGSHAPSPHTPTTPVGQSPPRRNSGLSTAQGSNRPSSPAAVAPQSPNNGNNNWWKKVGDQIVQKPMDTAIKVGSTALQYGGVGAAAGSLYNLASSHAPTAAYGAGAAALAGAAMTATGGVVNALNTAKNDQQTIRDKDRDKGRDPGAAGSKFGSAWNNMKGWVTGNSRTAPADASNMARRSLYLDDDSFYEVLAARGFFDLEEDMDDYIW